MLKTKEHYDLMAQFEKEFRGLRMDKEDKELWPKGRIYASGETDMIFDAYRRGYALGKSVDYTQSDK